MTEELFFKLYCICMCVMVKTSLNQIIEKLTHLNTSLYNIYEAQKRDRQNEKRISERGI